MSAYVYPLALAVISIFVAVAERLWPWRPEQKQLRRRLPSDFAHLVFNAHFLGVILYGLSIRYVMPHVDGLLAQAGFQDMFGRAVASDWSLWIQILVVLIGLDFIHWSVHNLLHRFGPFWRFHQTHHSVVDGEMDWIVSFRFQWTEVVVYKSIQYLPMAFFGFAQEAILVHAIFGTLIGHLNHSNLNLGQSPLRYVFNSPRMHIWHHDKDRDGSNTVNFGIIFSTWDWIFGTAHMPNAVPEHIGFKGDETFPRDFLTQAAWPLSSVLPATRLAHVAAGAAGLTLLGAGWFFAVM